MQFRNKGESLQELIAVFAVILEEVQYKMIILFQSLCQVCLIHQNNSIANNFACLLIGIYKSQRHQNDYQCLSVSKIHGKHIIIKSIQRLQDITMIREQIHTETKSRKYSKKTFEISNSAGKLHIEVNAFERYYFVIVSYANLLKIDGCIQLVHPTPYNAHPSVINITTGYETTSEDICKRLGKQLNCPIVLSLNLQLSLNKKGEDELYQALLQILRSMK